MINAIIIEDEINAREALTKILKLIGPSVKIIAETGYVSEAIKLIESKKPQLVFLDIKLKEGNAFDILNNLNEPADFKIIFTTAYDEFALKAFKFSTIDYLLKPIDPTELKNAIDKAIIEINKNTKQEELISVLKNNLDNKEKKIVINTTNRNYIIPILDIIRLEADAAYTNFITKKEKIVTSYNINYYTDLLGEDFIRSHRSHLVNSKHIISLTKKGLLLSNNDYAPVSVRKKPEIISFLNNIIINFFLN